ncbi:MAG: hypothetical protein A2Z01_01065 [Betaproteobacteria bacterium RBG_16_58_11]|nr:MAG: hypothetical protein A2Z01_01065 [Betaproteobacteria bacterium RBG_16_58_11]
MALIPPLMRWAVVLHIVDIPDERKVHKSVIPRIGGIAMVVGTLLPLILWLPPSPMVIAYILGAIIILFFGVWDDRKNLGYRVKFLGQLVAVLVVVLYGDVLITAIPFWDELPFYIALPLTIFALLGITNAINLADGLDGLAGGTTLLSLGLIALLAYLADGANLVLITVAIMGGILGFLRFNSYPASVFMGDGGSQFLGFSAGVLAIVLTQETSRSISPALPLLFLGLPILDTLMVMGQRIYERRSPFSPDMNHIHHKLLALGYDHYEAVFLIYAAQAMLVSSAYFLRYQSDLLVLLVYLALCLMVLLYFHFAKQRAVRVPGQQSSANGFFMRKIRWLRNEQRPLKWAYYFALISIPAYLFMMSVLADRVPKDSSISFVSWALLALLIGIYLKRGNAPFHIIERACLYVAIVFVVYLLQVEPGVLSEYKVYRNFYFALLAIAVAIGMRFSGEEKFRVSTLDFLVIFVVITIPNLPGTFMANAIWGPAIIKVIILFYGVELVLANMWRRWGIMRFSLMATLAVLGFRGL